MMKQIKLFLIFCLIVGLFSGCAAKAILSNRDVLSPEQVVREHFKWHNEKNLSKLNETITERNKHINWMLENLDYIRIISITENKRSSRKEDYMTTGMGKVINPADLKIFLVKYEVKYKDTNKGPQPSGIYGWFYDVIKEHKDSPWLISDWGV